MNYIQPTSSFEEGLVNEFIYHVNQQRKQQEVLYQHKVVIRIDSTANTIQLLKDNFEVIRDRCGASRMVCTFLKDTEFAHSDVCLYKDIYPISFSIKVDTGSVIQECDDDLIETLYCVARDIKLKKGESV